MARKPSPLQLYHVAHSYYIENRDQDEIAASIGLSRSQVSRLLDQARKSGMVRFEVRFPTDIDAEALAESLRESLALEAVRIAPRPARPELSAETLASFAANILPELTADRAVIGVGWGRTIYEVALRMAAQEALVGRKIIPLVGSAGQQAPWLQINGIVDRLAEKYRAERVFIRMQAFLEADRGPSSRVEEENLDHITSLWSEVETAVIGLGMPADRAEYLQTEIDRSVLKGLQDAKAVGDILGRFFNAKGHEIDPGEKWRLVSMSLERLREMRSVICVCRGNEKVDGMIAAAGAGLFKTLITDAETAQSILARSSL